MIPPDADSRRLARRAARFAAKAPGGGIRRADLAADMGMSEAELGPLVGLAYAWRLVDCVRDFVLAVPAREKPPR